METPSCESLCEAARYNHDTCIQTFISTGADPDVTDNLGLGWTPLKTHDTRVMYVGFD